MRIPSFRFAAAAAGFLALAACADVSGPAPDAPEAPVRPKTVLAEYQCTASVRAGKAECRPAVPSAGVPANLILGDTAEIRLSNDNITMTRTADGDTMTTDVYLTNRLPQPIGTTEEFWVGPAPGGIRVYFVRGPVATRTSGSPAWIEVANPDGEETFLQANRKYFQYDNVVEPNDRSWSREWKFASKNVVTFSFSVLVSAPVPFPDGWLELDPDNFWMSVMTMWEDVTPTFRDYAGRAVPGGPVAWSSSDTSVMKVTQTGRVTRAGPGVATLTATETVPPGRSASIEVESYP
ncbi:MAG TPA: hypothetical protein VHG91_11525 [Longimicrobium sp.]|nr:hypothetical protein [Longimicrobium sp.]